MIFHQLDISYIICQVARHMYIIVDVIIKGFSNLLCRQTAIVNSYDVNLPERRRERSDISKTHLNKLHCKNMKYRFWHDRTWNDNSYTTNFRHSVLKRINRVGMHLHWQS